MALFINPCENLTYVDPPSRRGPSRKKRFCETNLTLGKIGQIGRRRRGQGSAPSPVRPHGHPIADFGLCIGKGLSGQPPALSSLDPLVPRSLDPSANWRLEIDDWGLARMTCKSARMARTSGRIRAPRWLSPCRLPLSIPRSLDPLIPPPIGDGGRVRPDAGQVNDPACNWLILLPLGKKRQLNVDPSSSTTAM